MNIIKAEKLKLKTKRTFLKKGTCSRTFFYLLNREYGHPRENEEKASDPLAGGILQQGYQCGMLWGASLAVGAESFRRNDNLDQAIAVAITATQHIMKSFVKRTNSIECEDITNCDWTNKLSMAKYFFSGRFLNCFMLAGKWAPDAIEAAVEGLSRKINDLPPKAISCAAEVAKKMGASDEEMVMVAGFAGGLGISGNGCGALAAAIWMNTLERVRNNTYKLAFPDPILEEVLNSFYQVTDYKMECNQISGRYFNSIDDHTEFIKNGGCEKLINVLAES